MTQQMLADYNYMPSADIVIGAVPKLAVLKAKRMSLGNEMFHSDEMKYHSVSSVMEWHSYIVSCVAFSDVAHTIAMSMMMMVMVE